MRIGSLKLDSNLFLSPLAGYTNLPFRLVVREIGGVGLCTTDLVNARSLLEHPARMNRDHGATAERCQAGRGARMLGYFPLCDLDHRSAQVVVNRS